MKKFLVVFLLPAFFSGCSSVSVISDYNTARNFSALRRYAWQHAEQPQTGDPRIDNDLNDERIRRAINATLTAKGFQLEAGTNVDFKVVYFIDFERKLNASSVSVGVGRSSYGRYGGMGYSTGITEYEEGNLTIDIIDAKDGKTIWRGVGTRAVYEGSNPAKATVIIDDAVAKILKKFPPK